MADGDDRPGAGEFGTQGDSYCGLYCGACSVLRHGVTGRRDAFAACCRGVPPGELACRGCKSDLVYAGCRVCAVRDCAVAKGVAHCVDCAEYPCRTLAQRSRGLWLLPHVGECTNNLEAIRRDGTSAWLAAQQRRWSCSACGAPFSWYATACAACGRELGAASYPMTGLRKVLCGLILPAVYRKGRAHAARSDG